MTAITHTVELHHDLTPCCDTSATRWALGAVHVRTASEGRAYLEATNTMALAIVPTIAEHNGQDVLLPMSCAKRPKGTNRNRFRAALNGEWRTVKQTGATIETIAVAPQPEGRFPNIPQCVSAPLATEYLTVSIDAQLLLSLAKSLHTMDAKSFPVQIAIPMPATDAAGDTISPHTLYVTPVNSDSHGFGQLMPMSNGTRPGNEPFRTRRDAYLAATK